MNQPPPVQPVMNQSDPSKPAPAQVQSYEGCPPQNELPNPMPQSEGPATAPPAPGPQTNDQPPPVQPGPDPASPPAAPVQPVINMSAPVNAVPQLIQTYKDYPVQIYPPNAIPQTAGPGQVPPAAGLQPQNQTLPVQTVMNQSALSNPAPHQVPSCTVGHPVQIYPPNAIPQTAGPGQVPPAAGLQPQNQTLPVQTVMNPSALSNPAPHQVPSYTVGHPVQIYPPNAIPQTAGPGQVPPAAGLQPQNQTLPVQTVMNPSPNPMPQPGQHPYPVGGYVTQVPPLAGHPQGNHPPPVQTVVNPSSPGHPVQNNLPNLMPQSEGGTMELQSVGSPVQPVLNQSGPSNPAPDQVQPYAAPAVPPLLLLYGAPPGLEYLAQIDQILVHQKMECIEMITGFETNNKYEIKNSIGQKIYLAKEKSNCFVRNFFGPARGFIMKITDHMDQEVIHLERPMRCCTQEIEVQSPPGITIGYVKQEWSCCYPTFSILGPNNDVLLKIRGPFLPFKCCGDINFEVKGLNSGQSIGRITKQRSGFIKKCISDSTNYCIQFPMDMDVKMKAVFLGACFLIDIMFFEKGGNLFLKLLKGF
ncbi:phospholipid scramblase 2-like isoform X2 [Carassius gibelio]|uniref:phospholipid scramblase 2-like isoform X2 n=1 Tax=Carassius gibelio TaxID=101364 RepID=UPI00227819F8|nr:phospholipid scramblase 2-like isoform X2 [Carassius gibelio]